MPCSYIGTFFPFFPSFFSLSQVFLKHQAFFFLFFLLTEKLILTHPPSLALKMRLSNARYTQPTNQSSDGVGSNGVDLVSFCAKGKNCSFHRVLSSPPHYIRVAFQCQIFWLWIRFPARGFRLARKIIMGYPQIE